MKYFNLKSILILLFFTLISTLGDAQDTKASILLAPTDSNEKKVQCFDIRIMINNDGYLGTQNYRLYYDASQMRYLRDRSNSKLTETGYSDLMTNQVVHNANAYGYGNLEYSATLGFINVSILGDNAVEKLSPMKSHSWKTSSEICFEMSENAKTGNIVWARPELTAGYSSAFTEVSLTENNLTFSAHISTYFDIQENLSQKEKSVLSSNNQQ